MYNIQFTNKKHVNDVNNVNDVMLTQDNLEYQNMNNEDHIGNLSYEYMTGSTGSTGITGMEYISSINYTSDINYKLENTTSYTDIYGYIINSSSGATITSLPNGYSNGTYILYIQTITSESSVQYSIWISDGTGGATLYTGFDNNFVFRANNGYIYLCIYDGTSPGNIGSIVPINGGLKLNQAIIYKYLNTGFLDTSESSNLLEPATLYQSVQVNDDNPYIENVIPANSVNPSIYVGNTYIFQLNTSTSNPNIWTLNYDNNAITYGMMSSVVLQYWIEGQIIYNTYTIYRPADTGPTGPTGETRTERRYIIYIYTLSMGNWINI